MKLFEMKIEEECAAKLSEQRKLSKERETELQRKLKETKEAHNQLLTQFQVQERARTEFNDIESVEKKLEQLGGVPESKKQALLVQGKQCWNTMQEMECAPNNG